MELDDKLSTRLRIENGGNPWWRLSVLLAHSGDSWFWLPGLGLIWIFSRGDWHTRSVLLAAGVFALAVLVMAIKFTVRRSRPPGEWGRVYRRTDPHSFPSGHAARAFLLMVMAWQLGPAWFAVALSVWAPLVAISRVSTGMHYLSDVLAGSLIGVIAAQATLLAAPLLVQFFPFMF